MLQITSKNFNKRRMKIDVQYGKNIQATPKSKEVEHVAGALYERFKSTKKVEIHMDFKLGRCAICEKAWSDGHFAIEKLMLVPVAGAGQKNVTVTIPRVVCHTCSKTMSDEDEQSPEESATSSTLGTAWRVHTELLDMRGRGSKGPTPQASPNLKPTFKSKLTQGNQKKGPSMARFSRPDSSPPVRSHPNSRANSGHMRPSPNLSSAAISTVTDGMESMSIGDAATVTSAALESNVAMTQSAVDKAGFLVCTQLVKTGGADKAGLQVGDIFARLGHMNKDNFRDLKDVANFIRRSANQSIEAVILRKQAGSDRPGGRGAVFHTIKLQLTPLQSHDADDGGVLGAVMNIWPLPIPATA